MNIKLTPYFFEIRRLLRKSNELKSREGVKPGQKPVVFLRDVSQKESEI